MKIAGTPMRVPIINPAAVQAYLDRPLDNYDFLKQAPQSELLDAARQAGHRFATEAWHNQLVCFNIGMIRPHFAFLLKQGGGKSKIASDLIRYRKRRGHLRRAIIIVPELLHIESWEDQLKTHAPDMQYQLLTGTRGERDSQLAGKFDICVMTYKALEIYMSHRRRTNGRRNKQVLDPQQAAEFASMFNFVVFDEAHRLGNKESLLFAMCRYLSIAADFRYAMTGTPFGRDPIRLWSQLFLVDHGETLGQLGMFQRAFFVPKKNDYAYNGMEWAFDNGATPELHRLIKHRSITYTLEELGQALPQRVTVRLPVTLTGEAAVYYRRILQGVVEARGDYQSLKSIFTRMRQCATGFLAMKADDESRIEVEFKDNPKIAALKDFILGKPDEKMLVFHEFTYSGRLIEKMLTQAKVGYAVLRGGVGDAGVEYRKFLDDPKIQIFVLQSQVGSEAINPQYVCRRAVFYESPVRPDIRDQAEGRVHRAGQEWLTFIHDIVAKGTVEEKVLRYVKEGRDLLAAVLSGDPVLEDE